MSVKKLKNELIKVLDFFDIKKNENLMIHCNSAGILQFENKKENYKIFWEILKKRIGNKGTVVIPNYNYKILKTKKKIKNRRSEVGDLTIFFQKNKDFSSTTNLVFSHSIYGKLKKNLIESNKFTAFKNDNNIFQKIIDNKFKILGFCCPINSATLIHYIEEKNNVPYRYKKKFKIKLNKKIINYDYFVGKKKFDYEIKESNLQYIFKKNKKLIRKRFGRFECWLISSEHMEKALNTEIRKNKYSLI